MMKHKLIEITVEQDKKLTCECKKLFLRAHPEFIGMILSRKFLLEKIIEYYLK